MATRLDIRVLGPVEVWYDGTPISLPGRQHRLILGFLAIELGKLVTFDRLVDLLWQEQLPQRPRSVLQTRVSELRTALGDVLAPTQGATLTARDGGYVLQAPPEAVDWNRFCELVSTSRHLDVPAARDALRRACDLWRGPALGGSVTDTAYQSYCIGLESARLTALEDLFDLEIRAGRHAEIVDAVVGLASANPARERLLVCAMTALQATGRSVEALQIFHRTRQWLVDELGVEPDKSARELYVHILRQTSPPDRAVNAPAAAVATRPDSSRSSSPGPDRQSTTVLRRPATIPRMLPPRLPDFVGRAKEIDFIVECLQRPSPGAPVVTVAGRGGIGKSALCTEVAHRLVHQYPDGQLYVNLQAFDARAPLSASDALGRLLGAFGVDGADQPDTLDERVRHYRQLTADRRILVLLDNAADDDQVAPLIPSSHQCAVLISSRMRVGAVMGAAVLDLGPFDLPTSADLMARVAGPGRLKADPGATAELVSLCGYLPLAVRIVAGKLANRPHWEVRDLTSRLRDERRRLDHLKHGSLDVKASITFSYRTLSREAKRLFTRIGDIDPPEVSHWLAAVLLECSWSEAGELLDELFDAHLIEPAGRDFHDYPKYRLHDLLRLFARERAHVDSTTAESRRARRRVFGALLAILDAIVREWPGLEDYGVVSHRNYAPPMPEHLDAVLRNPLQWFASERSVVSAIIRRALEDEPGELGWTLASAASPLYRAKRYFDDWREMLAQALVSARSTGDRVGISEILRRRALLLVDRRVFDEALACYGEAAQLADAAGDRHGAAVSIAGMGMVERFRERYAEALDHYQRSLPILSEAGDSRGTAYVLRGVGQIHLEHGRYEEAEAYLERSRQLYEQQDNSLGAAAAAFWQGMLRLRQRRPIDAVPLFDQVLSVTRELGEVAGQAQALRGLGLAYRDLGRIEEARRTLREAHALVASVGVSLLGEYIRRDLEDLNGRDGA